MLRFALAFILLLLCGDIESNPGPKAYRICPNCNEQVHVRQVKCKYGFAMIKKKGRPAGTSAEAGFRVSTGRKKGTAKEAGYNVTRGRTVGTTVNAGFKADSRQPVEFTKAKGFRTQS